MLRVSGPSGPPMPSTPPEEAVPPPPPEAPPPPPEEPPMEEPSGPSSKVMPAIAVYMTPDLGPFKCANCAHFDGQAACDIVDGPIDPEGMCHIFTPMGGGDEAPPEEEMAEGEPPMPPAPTAGPPMPPMPPPGVKA